ncbi:MAG: ABC transporter substrate-binding protein [Burkholderiales bacterium]|nr:ABC transporter substrate-binding protein [Burkholderiales bacterium]
MRAALAALAFVLAGCASAPPSGVVGELAPTGKLRAVINYGNPVLATRGPDGQPKGVSVDLARELAKRLGVPVDLTTVDAARVSSEMLRDKRVDLGFVAIDPARSADFDQTSPYVLIEGAYMVRAASPLQRNEDVDRAGTRISVGRGSAYDLYLTRVVKAATLVRSPTSGGVVNQMLEQNLDVAAGVKQQLEADAKRVGGLRMLPGRFMVIEQAMGVPKGRTRGYAWLNGFIEEMKASGFVAEALKRHGIEGAAVAPPGAAR